MFAALDGVTIVDFSRVLAGPLATMVLADLGATVVKVERPETGDDTRAWGPPYADDGSASYFLSVNRNKSSVAIDLRSSEDLARLRPLLASADAVVENFRPGAMERLGLGYEDLRADNPSLVYCSITGFGRDGGAQLPGYDLLIQALGGLMSITGEPDGEPQKVGVALVDVTCGLFAATGLLAALRHRDRTGEGQRVDVDLLSSLLAALVNQASAVTTAGASPRRLGNAHPSIAPYEVLPCGDGDLVLACGNDRQFGLLAAVLDAPGLATDERFATNAARVAHRDDLRTTLIDRLRDRPAREWAALLLDSGVPAGEVNTIGGALDLATRLGLTPTVDVPRADGTPVTLVRNPIGLSRTPATYRSAPPELGAHQGLLDASSAVEDRAVADGAVAAPFDV